MHVRFVLEAAIGATVIGDHRTPEGLGWIVLQDPEGNEFCVEPGPPGVS